MSKIYRDDFTSRHAGRAIDVDKASRDHDARTELDQAGLSVEDLRRADRNRDGKVDAEEAWKAADDFDHDGTRGSLIDVDPSRPAEKTEAGKAAGAFGVLLAKGELQPSNDGVVFVGMNEDNKHEASYLRRTGAHVTAVHDSTAGDDRIRVGGRTYNLQDAGERLSFARNLGLPEDQAQKVADAIGTARYDGWGMSQTDAMDEVAQVAQIWAKAEHGGTIPSRMVISGHHVGDGVWGDDNGEIAWTTWKNLAEAMPHAAAQVEDLNISGCYSAGADMEAKLKGIFPKLKTVWGYSGTSPGTWGGAIEQQKEWERATRGSGTDFESGINRLRRTGSRHAENIRGVAVEQPQPYTGPSLSELRERLRQGEPLFERCFSGQQEVDNPREGLLRDYYTNAIQAALDHPDLSADVRQGLEARREQCIRTLYYRTHIGPKFQREHQGAISAGYRALGLEPPDFADLSRASARDKIDQFRTAYDAAGSPPQAAQDLAPLLNGLWNLDPRVIPARWI